MVVTLTSPRVYLYSTSDLGRDSISTQVLICLLQKRNIFALELGLVLIWERVLKLDISLLYSRSEDEDLINILV